MNVEQHGRPDYLALLDDQPIGFFEYSHQAEYAAYTALTEALAREAIAARDEKAEIVEVGRHGTFSVMFESGNGKASLSY